MVANNSNRIEWIDAAKGIGIWLVVTGHLMSGKTDSSRTIATIIWAFHMPLFFFLSGFSFKAPNRSWAWGELTKNIYSIVVPYLFFCFVSIALWLIFGGVDRSVQEAAGAVLYGISGPEQGLFFNIPLWFFTCLFSVKLTFFCLGSACNYDPNRIMVYSALLAIFAHLAFYAMPVPRLPWNFDVAFIALVFYSAGYLLSEYKIINNLSGKRSWLVLFLGIYSLLMAYKFNGRVDMNHRIFNSPPMYYFGAFGGIFLTIVIAHWGAKFKWLTAIGIASIVIFPMHGLIAYLLPDRVLSIMGWYAYRISGSAAIAEVLVGTAYTVLCMPFYWLLQRYAPTLIGRIKRNKETSRNGQSDWFVKILSSLRGK